MNEQTTPELSRFEGRRLRKKRRRYLENRRPSHLCGGCGSVTFHEETVCLHCHRDRPPDGWPELDDGGDAWLGRIVADRYLVTQAIGRGVSGRIYRVESLNITRQFALKIIATGSSDLDTEKVLARLDREIEALSQLRNPHIVSFYDVFDLSGKYIAAVMDLIQGETLETAVRRQGTFSVGRACSILRQAANGIAEAHQAGMIHRDLKPENMMLERLPAGDDFLHVLDFGLVRLNDGEKSKITRGFVGTPLYASPEQARGKDLDRRSDIYSLGAILFFMLAGRPPFESDHIYRVLQMQVQKSPPRPSEIGSGDIPPAIDELVEQMLSKSPENRPPDLEGVIDTLDRFGRSQSATPRTTNHDTPASGVVRVPDSLQSGSVEESAMDDGLATAVSSPGFQLPEDPSDIDIDCLPGTALAVLDRKSGDIRLLRPDETGFQLLDTITSTTAVSVAITNSALITGHGGGAVARRRRDESWCERLFECTPNAAVAAVGADAEGEWILAGSARGQLYVYGGIGPGADTPAVIDLERTVVAVTVDPLAEIGAVATDEWIHIFRPAACGDALQSWSIDGNPRSISLSPDGYVLAVTFDSGAVCLYSVPTGERLLETSSGNYQTVWSVEFTPAGEPMAVCVMERQLHLLDFDQLMTDREPEGASSSSPHLAHNRNPK